MADFGEAILQLPGRGARAQHAAAARPGLQVGLRGVGHGARRGRRLRASPGFAIDNAITQFDPANPSAIVFNKPFACGPHDAAGWDSYCKGDKRTVFHPRWVVRNRGRSRFRTDAYGRARGRRLPAGGRPPAARGPVGRVLRPENAFIMERPSDGGIYRAGRG